MDSFANRVVLITGAGSGIGRQMALTLAAEGAAVAALDLKPDGLDSLAAELKGKPVATAVADVTDRESLYPAVHGLESQVGPTDVLIANAGIGVETAADPYNAEGIEAQVRVNLVGVSNSVGAVLPGMIERRHGQLVGHLQPGVVPRPAEDGRRLRQQGRRQRPDGAAARRIAAAGRRGDDDLSRAGFARR